MEILSPITQKSLSQVYNKNYTFKSRFHAYIILLSQLQKRDQYCDINITSKYYNE